MNDTRKRWVSVGAGILVGALFLAALLTTNSFAGASVPYGPPFPEFVVPDVLNAVPLADLAVALL